MSNKGTIKFYNSEKGYGFCQTEGGDIFFHISDFNQQLYGEPTKGMPVEFTVGDSVDRKTGATRTRAREIKPLTQMP